VIKAYGRYDLQLATRAVAANHDERIERCISWRTDRGEVPALSVTRSA
jgi:hypothetical protein